MVDRAKAVGNPVLAAMADQQQVALAEGCPATRALLHAVGAGRLERLTGAPVGTLHGPGDDVLETAEGRAAVTLVLAEPEPLARLDRGSTPGTADERPVQFLDLASIDSRP
jgi:hypothetical protein